MITEKGKEIKTLAGLEQNRIICDSGEPDLGNSSVTFNGNGNILYLESPLKLRDSKITFGGDHALVYLSSNRHHTEYLKIDAWRETTIYIGKDNYFNGGLNCIISERKNLIIGDSGVFSFGIWIRTADPHLLYSIEDMQRINLSQSIIIGDHVWLGQSCMLLKGSKMGSGSVLAAGAILANKTVESNSVFAGNPAKKIKSGVFFVGKSVHNYTEEDTAASMKFTGSDFIYETGSAIDCETLDQQLSAAANAEKRLNIVREKLVCNKSKNRFYLF